MPGKRDSGYRTKSFDSNKKVRRLKREQAEQQAGKEDWQFDRPDEEDREEDL